MAKTFKLKLSYFTLTVHVHRENKYSYKETPSSLHTYIAKNKTKEHKKVFYHLYRKMVQIAKAHSPVCIWVPNCC